MGIGTIIIIVIISIIGLFLILAFAGWIYRKTHGDDDVGGGFLSILTGCTDIMKKFKDC